MEKDEICPQCGKGKLSKRFFEEEEMDILQSHAAGIAAGINFLPTNKSIRYVEEFCNKCSYRRKYKQ